MPWHEGCLQEAFTLARKCEKLSALRNRFSELFAVMEILSEDATPMRALRRSATRITAHPTKRASHPHTDNASDVSRDCDLKGLLEIVAG